MFILGSAYQEKNIHVGCAMVIIGDDEPFASGDEQKVKINKSMKKA